MVRKYNPEIKHTGDSYSDNPYDNYSAVMSESQHGNWVKLSTYNDEIGRLSAKIERMKKQHRKHVQDAPERPTINERQAG